MLFSLDLWLSYFPENVIFDIPSISFKDFVFYIPLFLRWVHCQQHYKTNNQQSRESSDWDAGSDVLTLKSECRWTSSWPWKKKRFEYLQVLRKIIKYVSWIYVLCTVWQWRIFVLLISKRLKWRLLPMSEEHNAAVHGSILFSIGSIISTFSLGLPRRITQLWQMNAKYIALDRVRRKRIISSSISSSSEANVL